MPKKESDKIKFVHFGTLHYLKDYYWVPFFEALAELKQSHQEVYNKIEIHLVGYCPKEVLEFIEYANIDVVIHGMLDPFKAYNELNQADIALWFKYDGSPGDFATKFGDYIATKKYMWTFSKKGSVTEYINKHKIGKVFYRDNPNLKASILQSFIECTEVKNRIFNQNYNNSEFKISTLTENLIETINS